MITCPSSYHQHRRIIITCPSSHHQHRRIIITCPSSHQQHRVIRRWIYTGAIPPSLYGRCAPSTWRRFRQFHYKTARLSSAARCFELAAQAPLCCCSLHVARECASVRGRVGMVRAAGTPVIAVVVVVAPAATCPSLVSPKRAAIVAPQKQCPSSERRDRHRRRARRGPADARAAQCAPPRRSRCAGDAMSRRAGRDVRRIEARTDGGSPRVIESNSTRSNEPRAAARAAAPP